MAGLFNILKVTVSEDKICAHVLVNPGMPLMTSEDIEATARVYYLVPAIAKHLCLGDSGREFQDCMGQTELCHLLEHVTVELMNETGLAGSISCGRTRVSEHDERVFEIELSCPDDALTIGALSSATFMMDWAYLHADQPAPDVGPPVSHSIPCFCLPHPGYSQLPVVQISRPADSVLRKNIPDILCLFWYP